MKELLVVAATIVVFGGLTVLGVSSLADAKQAPKTHDTQSTSTPHYEVYNFTFFDDQTKVVNNFMAAHKGYRLICATQYSYWVQTP
jgi:hypothetical protein